MNYPPAETQDDDKEIVQKPRFGISEETALVLRWAGHLLLGAMVCLLIVWALIPTHPSVMLFITIVISTIGVMCEILGWISGLAAWLLRCLKRILDHFERERIRRGEALFGELALLRTEVSELRNELSKIRTEGEVDRGRVVAMLEQALGRLIEIETNQREIIEEQAIARDERAEMAGDLSSLRKDLCEPYSQPRRRKRAPRQPQEKGVNGVGSTGSGNVLQLPSQDTMRAAERLARRVLKSAEDKPEDKI